MEISLTGEDITAGVKRGLELLDSDIAVPSKWQEDLIALKYLLRAIQAGSYKLEPNRPEDSEPKIVPPDMMPPGMIPPTGANAGDSSSV